MLQKKNSKLLNKTREDIMSNVTFKNNPVKINGELPKKGDNAPDFILTKTDLSDVSLKDFKSSIIVLNIFPSIDTPVCAASVRRFNTEAGKLGNCKVLCVSKDLPFAHNRFCETEGIENVIPVCELRNCDFGSKYGIRIAEGPLAGLLTRSVVVIDQKGRIAYTQLVQEITNEPDYEDVLNFIKSM
jgi:thiol peroxidase